MIHIRSLPLPGFSPPLSLMPTAIGSVSHILRTLCYMVVLLCCCSIDSMAEPLCAELMYEEMFCAESIGASSAFREMMWTHSLRLGSLSEEWRYSPSESSFLLYSSYAPPYSMIPPYIPYRASSDQVFPSGSATHSMFPWLATFMSWNEEDHIPMIQDTTTNNRRDTSLIQRNKSLRQQDSIARVNIPNNPEQDSTAVNDSTEFIRSTDIVSATSFDEWLQLRLQTLADSLGIRSSQGRGYGGARTEFGRNTMKFPVPKGYGFQAKFDSTLSKITVRDTLFGLNVSIPQTLPVQSYIDIRKNYQRRRIIDSVERSYDLRAVGAMKGELSRILSQNSLLTIPIPPNPLMGIFGKPEISINVNVEINLRAGWRWDTQNLGVASVFGQTQSAPMFNQDIQANVSANIGDKFRLGTDWSTRRQFDFDNLFRIGFDGYDDDIIKRVEVGNVSLPVPATLIGGSQALFGVRADFQFGPLFLKTILSQRRGQRKTVSINSGSLKQRFSLRAYDYAINHFFLDTTYKNVYRSYFSTPTLIIPATVSIGGVQVPRQQFDIKEIEVWETTNDLREVQAIEGVAFADLEQLALGQRYSANTVSNAQIIAGAVERGRFIRLDPSRFSFNQQLGTLSLNNLRRDRTYAVAYRVEGATQQVGDDRVTGTLSNTLRERDTLILKMVYRPNIQPSFGSLWQRQMRNIYQIPAQNVDITQTKIEMWYYRPSNDSVDIVEGSPEKIVTMFGVDRQDAGGAAQPDGAFDMNDTRFFNPARGELTFPSIEPFREGLITYFSRRGQPEVAQQYTFPAVYDTLVDIARLNAQRDRFVITGEVSGSASDRITLPNAYNLQPGSITVTLDGTALTENIDYRVEYFMGQIQLINPLAMRPGANVSVEYEQNDLFNIATRTMVGMRGDFDMKSIFRSWGWNTREIQTNFGFTAMHYDQALIVDRVRLGEEPVSNTMLGFDASVQYETKWLTRALNLLPFYSTKAPSSITFRGEWALMMPDPNKKKSDIPSDNGASVVHLDDFEGAQRYIPLGITPGQWTHASPPLDDAPFFNNISRDPLNARRDTIETRWRGNSFWFRYNVPETPLQQVYPNRGIVQGSQNVPTLHIRFNPDERGIYNRNPDYQDSITFASTGRNYLRGAIEETNPIFSRKPSNRNRLWGGMMRLLSPFNTNFDTDNVDFIEIMMQVEQSEPNTQMFIDLGQISEDVIPNQVLDTEDGITPVNPVANGRINSGEEGEDVGIDALSDDQERGGAVSEFLDNILRGRRATPPYGYPTPLNQEPDPARDNYFFNFSIPPAQQLQQPDTIFSKTNNYEGNATLAQTGTTPDTEVLNRNNGQTISLDNSFFRYRVNLDPNTALNPQVIQDVGNGWRLYRIPIRSRQYRTQVGNPTFANVQYVRVWYKGGALRAKIADWRLAGAQWLRAKATLPDGATDTTMSIAFINREENSGAPDFYTMPPGVNPPAQLNNPDPNQDIRLNEQSMAVNVTNLRFGDERMAIRIWRPMDIFFYKKLKFFMHGDGAMPTTLQPGSVAPAIGFIRFGVDSSNYYEYRRPLLRGWQDLTVELEKITAIKQTRDSALTTQRYEVPVPGDTLAHYAVVGNPTLTRIQFIGFGIANPAQRFPASLTTTMWVNELRLTEAENRADWAATLGGSVRLADLGTVNIAYTRTNPNFHRLEERFGNRINRETWNITSQFALERFLPTSWAGTSIPLAYSRNEFIDDPLFVAQNDINVAAAAAETERRALVNGLTPEQARSLGDQVRQRSQTLSIENTLGVSGFRLGLPTTAWWARDVIGKLQFGMNYTERFERSPVVAERLRWQWNMQGQYSTTFQPAPVYPFGWAENVPILSGLAKWKINPYPQTVSATLMMERSRQTEQSRFIETPNPVVRSFTAQRQLQFNWQLSDQGLLNPTLDYTLAGRSTLVPFELDENNLQRSGSEVFSRLFLNNGKLFNVGEDLNYRQNFALTFRPRIFHILGIDQFAELNGSFATDYQWQQQLQANPEFANFAKAATFNNNQRWDVSLRLRDLGDKIFGTPMMGGKRMRDSSGGFFKSLLSVVQTVFFDFDRLTMAFNQTNSATNPGIYGGTGVTNFWSRGALLRGEDPMWGPSLAYQLGLVANPHGGFRLTSSSAFPFFGFETFTGLRPGNGAFQDNFTQQNTLDFRTGRQIWEGATLDITWRSQFGFNRTQTATTTPEGVPTFTNVTIVEQLSRSIVSLPLPFFTPSIENVAENYRVRREAINAIPTAQLDTARRNQALLTALSESFLEGFETLRFLPFVSRNLSRVLPGMNWSFRWDGMEKLDWLNGIAQRISLEHRYTGQYQSNRRITDFGVVPETETIRAGFEPLIGLNMVFNESKIGGFLTANMRWNSSSNYVLNSSQRSTVARESSNDLSLNISFTKRGMKFEFLGMEQPNDLEIAVLGTYRRSQRATFDILQLIGDSSAVVPSAPGAPADQSRKIDGTTAIVFEPSARYTISNRVSARAFFRLEANFTEGAAQPGNRVTQVGLDIRITIAGGR